MVGGAQGVCMDGEKGKRSFLFIVQRSSNGVFF